MGCVHPKQAVSVTPVALDHSGALNGESSRSRVRSGRGGGGFVTELELSFKKVKKIGTTESGSESAESRQASSNASVSFRLGNLHKYAEADQVAAGWPAWLSAVAGEAIQGWVPRQAESFEKLEKIGQGTYSTVFRARDLETGKIVALKKVRFDNFDPESVRFMAREILILRRLDHPNIIKLEGLVTSRSSRNIYLVFEYMEHDISGLLASPEIVFTEAQVKCYMKQLLSGLGHCHSRGVMHRDIKAANLLVDNEGVLKIADFGLANFCTFGQTQPLTSRVVTLWYRPPELLLGSTNYGPPVDLWSVGCVLAELLVGKPILQGRTEVEQLHKIFKLCGSPPQDYWKISKLPHATLFKPPHPYQSSLRQTFKDMPQVTITLIETLLAVEPFNRGTATSALSSEYFKTNPYACEPSSLPKYRPSKDIDITHHEEARRKPTGGRSRGPETRKNITKLNNVDKLAPEKILALPKQVDPSPTTKPTRVDNHQVNKVESRSPPKPSPAGANKETSHVRNASQGDDTCSGPLQVSGSSGFAWAKRRPLGSSLRSRSRSSSRSLAVEPSGAMHLRSNNLDSNGEENRDVNGEFDNTKDQDSCEIFKPSLLKKWSQFERPGSFDASDGYRSRELSTALYRKEEPGPKRNNVVYNDQGEKVEFSGPLLSQSRKIDELLEKHDHHIRQVVRRSWFQRVRRNGK